MADTVFFKEETAIFEQGPIFPLTSDEIPRSNAIPGIKFLFEAAMTKLMHKIVTVLQNRTDNRLSVALESLIEPIVKKVASSPQTNAQTTEAVNYNPGCQAKTATFAK